MQILPDLPGSTAIVETTADCAGSEMHSLFSRTQAGSNGDWQSAFFAWYLMDEYRKEVPPDFELAADEQEMAALYKLSPELIYWYRRKRSEMGDDKRLQREFPSNETEPWISVEVDSLIDPADVLRAMKTTDLEPHGDLILGVDVAGRGKDATAIAHRRGRVVTKVEKRHGLTATEVAGWIGDLTQLAQNRGVG